MTRAEVGVVSMSARSPEGRDAEYIEWHALDHLPEQYRIDGIKAGTRWVSTPACRATRAVSGTPFDEVDHVVMYLFGGPLETALEAFFAHGADLRAAGRMPLSLPSVELGGYRLDATAAAPRVSVDADVLPWRPAKGVYLLMEEGGPAPVDLVDVPGVAGVWSFLGDDALHPRLAPTAGRRLTVCYLDDDLVATANRLHAALRTRWERTESVPLMAAPLVSLMPWKWDIALPS
jgi:hypothetical protein